MRSPVGQRRPREIVRCGRAGHPGTQDAAFGAAVRRLIGVVRFARLVLAMTLVAGVAALALEAALSPIRG